MNTITIVKRENIYKYMESLRKLGVNAYVLQWGSNTGSDFVIFYKERTQSNIKFNAQIEALDSYTQNNLKDMNIISNIKFRELYKSQITFT